MTNQEQYELICEKAKKYDRLVRVLDKIRAEIYKTSTFYYGTELSYGLDLAIKIVDKYIGELK